MKYQLRGKQLQEAYRRIYPDFDEKLDKAAREQIENPDEFVSFTISPPFQKHLHVFRFLKDMIEAVPVYTPDVWNSFPDINPPENVWMRVETHAGLGFKAYFADGFWFDGDCSILRTSDQKTVEVVLFRPWED